MKKVLSMILVFSLMFCSAMAMAETAEDTNVFVITLNANPTTGYSWQYVLSDESMVALEEEYLPGADTAAPADAKPESELLSVESGLAVFTLKGVKPGEVTLSLKYGQEWDAESTVAELSYTLRINDDLSVACVASTVGI